MISKNKTKLIRSLATKKGRDKSGLFVAEGPKVCHDLIAAGFTAEILVGTDEAQLPAREWISVTEEELRPLSLLQHPQGVLGVFRQVTAEDEALDPNALTLMLDGVQDPGNLGTIIRIADWFGIATIVCSRDTADCWNPKVVQATMGSIARVHIKYADLEQTLDGLPEGYPVYGTLLDGHDIYAEDLSPHGIIVMGNEGKGISAAIRQRVNRRLLIPSWPKDRPTAESLNVAVATAITCGEFRRRQK